MNITDSMILQLDFRRNKAEEKIKEISSLFDGRQASILTNMQDEDGIYSEQNTKKFIEHLLDCLERYKKYVAKDPEYTLSEKEKDFYAAYLYCTIRGIAHNRWGALMWAVPCKTYQDIINMAKDPETLRIHTKEELYYEELYEPVTGGFFGYMDEVFLLLTGKNINTLITEEEKEKIFKVYPEAAKINQTQVEMSQLEAEMRAEISEEEFDNLIEENLVEDEFLDEIYASRERWAQSFGYASSFCEYYQKYREMYFEVERYDFISNIENMIDLYLMEQEISCFGEEDKFLKAYTVASQSYTRIKNYLREGA